MPNYDGGYPPTKLKSFNHGTRNRPIWVARIGRSLDSWIHRRRTEGWKGLMGSVNIMRVLWILLLIWGEVWTYTSTIRKCEWKNWEAWPAGAKPARVALIADPQLIDPHTYDRNKYLMVPSMYYTDKFLIRSYREVMAELQPPHVLFLGDLFDGGREWDTIHTNDKPKGVGQGERAHFNDAYWHGEYERFQKIFPNYPGVLTIKSLPGNHDLGFGGRIKPAVYERFRTYFGETNTVWEIGNHSFVMVDSVSMSDDRQDADGWKVGGKAKEWLEEYGKGLHQPIPRTTTPRKLMPQNIQHATEGPLDDGSRPPPQQNLFSKRLPTILLTHVPLYRAPSTDCGVLREKKSWGNGIPIHAGYQYSNVLSHQLSRELLQTVSPLFVFSGDDHDYCVVEHAGVGDPGKGVLKTGRWGLVKEVTVKSFSWAMGIRRPGFVQVSLYYPDEEPGILDKLEKTRLRKTKKKALETEIGTTIQTHLCLLPDQIGIFIRYGVMFGLCLVFILFKSIKFAFRKSSSDESLLPVNVNHLGNSHLEMAQSSTTTLNSHLAPNSFPKNRPNSNVSSGPNSRSTSPNGSYAYYDKDEPVSPLSNSDDEKDKYNKGDKGWLGSSYATSPAAAAARRASEEAKEVLLGNAKKFVTEKKFAAQKILQSSQLGRQVVKGWRKNEGKFRRTKVGRCCGMLGTVFRSTFRDLFDVGIVVFPVYFWLLTRW